MLLERLAQTQPVVLMLDDVHWADPASVELLGAILRRPPAAQVLLALAVRPRQMGERLTASVERAHRAGTLARLELRALTAEEARELVGDTLNGAEPSGLYRESGGNPFYLEQLARSARRPDNGACCGGEPVARRHRCPAAGGCGSRRGAGVLSEQARLVLQGAAVAGDPFDPELAAAAAGAAETAAIDALDELLRLDVVRPTDVPRRFRFRHPLVRRVGLRVDARRLASGCPQALADALRARGSPAAARAHHVERSAHHGDITAVALLREAGYAAAQRTPESAARWFGAALRLLPATAPVDERVELLVARSRALAAAGQMGEATRCCSKAMKIVPEESEAVRVRLAAACAAVEHLRGRYQEAHAHLEAAFGSLRDPGSPQGVGLMVELAGDALYRGDYDAMRAWAARAVDAGEQLRDRPLLASALAVRALASAVSGAAAEGQAHRAEAAELIDQLSDDELGPRLDALTHLATAELYLDQFMAIEAHAGRALRIGRVTGQGDLFPLIVPMLGASLWIQGKMKESGEALDGAIAASRLVDNVQGLAWNLFNRSYAAFAAGDIELALATAQEGFDLATERTMARFPPTQRWRLRTRCSRPGIPIEASSY